MPRRKPEQLKNHDFKPAGTSSLDKVPVSVRLPVDIAEYVRSQPNRTQWLIAAISRQMMLEQKNS